MRFEELVTFCAENAIDVCDDTRKLKNGDIFVAHSGTRDDGKKYVNEALAKGASFIVGEFDQASLEGNQNFVFFENSFEALELLANARWKIPSKELKLVGITGTNGKTTCAWLLEHLFKSTGMETGLFGTVTYRWPGSNLEAPLTTPSMLELYSMLSAMEKADVKIAIMEVSSHALSQERTGKLPFSGALFTNLTQDHLDYHNDLEDYFRAKARLFLDLPYNDKKMAINSDDPFGKRLLEKIPTAVAYGLHENNLPNNFLRGTILSSGPDGLKLEMKYSLEKWQLRSPLVGEFNALNLLGVQALALELGFSPQDLQALEDFGGVCGRLEKITNPQGLHVFVDYAHTPDALENVLKALRKAGFKRIITVFGCGGNRDRGKRPLMGKAVASYGDVAILTSDNPRFEDPYKIMNDVLPGLSQAKRYFVEVDRRKATELGLNMLEKDDALLIAGKGHENYQIFGDKKSHYSDQEVVREYLHCV